MRFILVGVLLSSLLSSCGNGAKKSEGSNTSSVYIEQENKNYSIPFDSAFHENEVHEEDARWEIFDDFIYEFSTNKKLQKQRIKFPLTVEKEGYIRYIKPKDWHYDDLFTKQGFYSFLFNSINDLEKMSDYSLKSIKLESVYLDSEKVSSFSFEKEEDGFYLNQLKEYSLASYDEKDFVYFFKKFANDSLYQSKHIQSPLSFITIDPDDEFSVLKTIMPLNQWHAFKPDLRIDYLFNICYDSKREETNNRVIALRGIGNGLSNILYFKKESDVWLLYKFEDVST